MRWTKEAEDMLWSTVFKTHSFHIDLDKVSAEWPGDAKPTPKALKEHLTKYRKNIGGEGRITFGMSTKKTAGGESDSAPTTPTPRKRRAKYKKVKEEDLEGMDDDGGQQWQEDEIVCTPKKARKIQHEDA